MSSHSHSHSHSPSPRSAGSSASSSSNNAQDDVIGIHNLSRRKNFQLADAENSKLYRARYKDCCLRAPNEPREQFGWYFHSVARAPFLLAVAAFFGPYLTTLATFEQSEDGKIVWMGISIRPSSYVAVFATVAALLSAIMAPPLGSYADHTPHRRTLMIMNNHVGAISGVICALIVAPLWWLGGWLYVVAIFCYEMTLSFLYSYLPEIAEDEKHRSHLSTKALVWANVSQVISALALTVIVLIGSSGSIKVDNNSFEDSGDIHRFSIQYMNSSSALVTKPCPWMLSSNSGSELVSCAQSSQNDKVGKYSLRVFVHQDVASLGDVSILQDYSGKATDFQGKTLLFSSECVAMRRGSFTELSIRTDMVQRLSSRFAIPMTFESRHVFLDSPSDATKLRFLVKLSGGIGNTYYLDDWKAATEVNSIQAIVTGLTGLSWLLFGAVAFNNLKPRAAAREVSAGVSVLRSSIMQVYNSLMVARELGDYNVYIFLCSLMFYSAGIAALIAVTGLFLQEQVRLDPASIGAVLLAAQVIGAFSARFFHWMGQRTGMKVSFMTTLVLWFISPIITAVLLRGENDKPYVVIVAALIGISLGGSIAQARAFFSNMVPDGQEAEYFGMWNFASKVFVWSGTLMFAVVNEMYGDLGIAISSLSIFFLIALIIMAFVRYERVPKQNNNESSIELNAA